MGDLPGHPFRGNQWTSEGGGHGTVNPKLEHDEVARATAEYVAKQLDRKGEVVGIVHRGPEALVLIRAKDKQGDFAMLWDHGEVTEDSLDPSDFYRNGG